MSVVSSEILFRNSQRYDGWIAIGFMSDNSGKIQTILSDSPDFQTSFIEYETYKNATHRRISLQEWEVVSVFNPEIQKSQYWNYLPEDLRLLFESWNIIITSGEDIYKQIDSEIYASRKWVSQKIQSILWDTSWTFFLNHCGDLGNSSWWRGASLVSIDENWEVSPCIVRIEGNEYIIELKWCGLAEGWFSWIQRRYNGSEWVVWWATGKQGKVEFDNLEKLDNVSNYKIGWVIFFEWKDWFKQSYIIRLSPSSIRASYHNNSAFPEINTSEVIKDYAITFVEIFFGNFPRIIEMGSWHLENLSVSGRWNEFTDYSDHVPLYSNTLPHINTVQTPVVIGFHRYVHYFINTLQRLKWYDATIHEGIFKEAMLTRLAEKSIYSAKKYKNSSLKDFVLEVFGEYFIPIIWTQRVNNSYSPREFLDSLILPQDVVSDMKWSQDIALSVIGTAKRLILEYMNDEYLMLCFSHTRVADEGIRLKISDMIHLQKEHFKIINNAFSDPEEFIRIFSSKDNVYELLNFYSWKFSLN